MTTPDRSHRWCGEDGYTAPPDTITEDALIAAAKFLSEYAMPAAEPTYGDAACPEADRNLTTLARWIAKQRPNAVHVRDMQRNIRLPGLVTADAIHAACKALIEAGWLVISVADWQRRTTIYCPMGRASGGAGLDSAGPVRPS